MVAKSRFEKRNAKKDQEGPLRNNKTGRQGERIRKEAGKGS